MFVMLLGSFTYAQITDGDYFSFICSAVSPVSDGTRAERLAYIQTLATGNTTIDREDDISYNGVAGQDGDIFVVSYEGSNPTYSQPQRSFAHGANFLAYGYIEDSHPIHGLPTFYSIISEYVIEAQEAYDNAAEISATGTLTLASDEDIANATSNDARKHLFSVFSNKTNTNGISITSVSFALNETYGYEVTITVPNISTGYNAYTYGFYNSFAAMDPGTFEAFYKNVYAQIASYN